MSSTRQPHRQAQRRPARAVRRSRRTPARPRLSRLLALLLAGIGGGSSFAQVAPSQLPVGGQVVVGSGQLQYAPNLLVVQQHGARLGLDWQSFNIGSQAVVEFRQPSADAIALNRVLGHDGSQIFGRLQANGQVFLSNPNGVLFAPGAKVDVGGLVATTLDLSQADFAAGRYVFGLAGSGSVVNQGSLQATSGGYVALLANRVENHGEITVPAGSVMLASGRAATVSIAGHGLISAVVDPGSVAGRVEHSGSIVADGGTVRLSAHSAEQIAASLVNSSGIVRANTLVDRGGEIWITGDHVATSGTLQANAPQGGSAGRVMVIGDLQRGTAQVAGTIEARASAGPVGAAQGGFVETSAARVDVADGTRVSTLAEGGRAGTWLIDPFDYIVAPSGGNITGATLSANLGNGNVTIASSQGNSGTAGNVIVNDTVSWSANRLTLNAHADIAINAAMNGSGTASLALEYGQGAVAAGNTASYRIAAPVNLPVGQNFSTKLGSNGTTDTFSVIHSLADLQAIDGNATVLAGRYALGADLDASSTAGANGGLGFNPIGNEAGGSTGFTGRFDGLGHTITGLTVNRPTAEYVGLFAWTDGGASVRHLRLTGGSITGQGHAGAITGWAGGASSFSGITSATPVTASRATGTVYAGGLVGRMVGNASSGIVDSSSGGAVSASSGSGGGRAGGLVGDQSAGQLVDGSATGNVTLTYTGTGQAAGYAGGLVGVFSSPAGIVRGSATGTVTGNYDAGGLVGHYNSAGAVTGSSATGAVSGTESVGGLIGYFAGGGALSSSSATGSAVSTQGSVGGLVGYVANASTLSQLQASGDASTSSTNAYAGGLVGFMSGGAINGAQASGKVVSGYMAGGLLGYGGSTAVSDATASGAVRAVGNSTVYAGGLIGYRSGTQAVSNSSASGAVFADGAGTYAGGLVGYSDGMAVSNSHATGHVTGRDSANTSTTGHYAGGLIGHFGWYNNQSISGSTASGNVEGRYYAGGLVGYFHGQAITDSSATGAVNGGRYAGGLVGYAIATTLTNLSATGAVTTNRDFGTAGGLIGYANTTGALSNLSASGQVRTTGTGSDSVGGLFGELAMSSGGLTTGFASGHVTAATLANGQGSGQAGGLIGYLSSSSNSGTGINDSAATGNVSGGQYTGGLIGQVANSYGYGSIANSRASGNVTGGTYAGGLVGYHFRSQPGSVADDIANSHASGAVSGINYVGGLVGLMYGRNGVVGSFATGSVTGNGSTSTTYLGGLIGYYHGYHASVNAPALVRESYATGDVGLAANATLGTNAAVYAGGLVGYLDGSVSSATPLRNVYAGGDVILDNVRGRLFAGGLVGYSEAQKIELAYADGAVAARNGNTRAAGGLLAARSNTNATVANAYWDTTATGQATSLGGGTGLTSTQMRQAGSFASFDIAGTANAGRVWRIYEGHTTPLLTRFLTPLTLTLADASKAYDGTTSFGNADLGNGVAAERIHASVASPDVGVYAVSAANVYSVQNGYDLAVSGNANLTINPRQLTLAGVVADKVYDGTRNVTLVANAQPGNLVAGEDLVLNTANMNAAFDTKHAGQNKTVAITGLALANGTVGKASNYTLAGVTGTTATITPKALNVGTIDAVDRAYDGSTSVALTVTPGAMTGAIANDDVQASLAGVTNGTIADKNVGTNKPVTVLGATLTGADKDNYVIAGIDAVNVDITPRALVINGLTASNRQYNATVNVTVSGTNATLQGAVAGDNVVLGDTSVTGTMADKHAGTGKLVTVDGSVLRLRGADAGNYAVTTATTTVDIAKYQTFVYAFNTSATNKVYDGTDAASVGLAFWSRYGGDDLGFTNDAPAYTDRHVAYANGAVTSKTINVNNIQLTGADAGNYQLTTTTASTTGTITPKPLTVSGVAAVDRVYDGTVDVSVNLANVSVDSSALLAVDQGLVTVNIPGAGTVVGTMATRHVGNNKPVTVPGFSLTGTSAGNYTLAGAGAGVTVNITPKPITLSYTALDKVYDGNAHASLNVSSADIVAGDTVRFYADASYCTGCGFAYFVEAGGTPSSFTQSKNAGVGKTVVVRDLSNAGYGSLMFGTHAGNYTVSNPSATVQATITPKGITPAFTGVAKVYDGTDAASVTLHRGNSGIIGNDAIGSTQTAVFSAGKAAGENKAVAISGIALNGADAGNYTLNATTAATTATITPKAVVVSGISATDRIYDGTDTVALVAGTLGAQGFVANDVVAVQPPAGGVTTGTMSDKHVGTDKPVAVTGLTLTGADAGNYVIDSAASGITVDIAPRPLLASFTGVNRAYNGGVTATVVGGSADLVANDVVTFAQSAVFTGINAAGVGTAKPIAVSNIVLGGTDAANYALQNTTASTTADITKKGITVNYTGGSRVYNGLADLSAPVAGSSVGIVAGDTVGFSQTAVFTGNGAVGTNKPVAVSGITLTGAQAGNYELANTTASTTATITRRPIGVVGVTATNRVYDGTRDVAVNTAGAVIDASNVVAADQGQVNAVLPPGGITSGLLETKDAGTNRSVTITGITLTGAMASNYLITGATGLVVDIAPKAITASYSAADKVYDGTATAQVSGTFSGVLPIDTGALGLSATGLFTAGKNAGDDKTVAVSGTFLTGVERNNYVLLNPTGSTTADITPKNLTPAYAGGTRVYDGGINAPVTAQTSGIIAGDSVSFGQTAVFTGAGAKNVGNAKPVAVSDIVLGGADAGNYRLTSTTASTTAAVTPKPIAIDGLTGASAVDRVYDGTRSVTVNVTTSGTLQPSSADIVAGDQVSIALPSGGITTGTMADKHAGQAKSVVVDGLTLSGTDAGNYVVAATSGVTVNIARKSLTASYVGHDKVYDGTAVASAGGTSADVIGNDAVQIVAGGVFTGTGAKNVGDDKAIVVSGGHLTGADARNYTLLNTTGTTTADITPRDVTASYVGLDKVYDGSTSANVRGSAAGFVAGDAVGLTQTAVFTGAGARNAGTNKAVSVTGITLTGADAGNYRLLGSTAGTTASITPKPLRIVGLTGVSAVNRVYDGTTNVVVNVTSTGPVSADPADVVAGDDVAVTAPSTGTTTGRIADKHAGLAKPVAVDGLGLTGAHAANYSITATSGVTVDIARRDVTATYAGVHKVYDGTATATVTGSIAGLIGGDAVAIGGSAQFTGAGAKNVGTAKPVAVTVGALTGADAANYNLLNTTATTTADITPKTVGASYTGLTRVYDGSVAAPVAGVLAGLVDGDAVTLAQTAVFTGVGAKNVGVAKPVAISGIALSGGDAGNYVLAADTAATTASVTPKPLRIDGFNGVTATDRVYDGTNRVAVTVSTTGPVAPNASDLVAGDVVTVTAPPAGSTTGTMLDKHAGQNKPVAVAGLTLGGADAGNYSVATTSGVTVNIAPKPLTAVYAVADKVYDGTAQAVVGGSSVDVVAGDLVTIGGTGTYTAGKHVGTGKAVAVTGGSLGGADGTNYALRNTTASLTASITPRPVDATYSGGTRVYDGTTAAPITSTATGLIQGDDVALSQQAAFTGAGARNVGDNKPILVSGIALSGSDAGNYTLLATAATTTGTVTPRPLNVTGLSGLTAVDRVYDGTTAVQIVGNATFSGGLSNIVEGDDVGVTLPGGSLNAGTMADKHAGQNKAVVLSGLALTGADAGNYAVTGTAGVSVNIAPRSLVVQGISAVDRTYDGTRTVGIVSSGGTLSGVLQGDDVSLGTSGVTATMADKHAGQGKAVDLAGLTLSGSDARNYVASGSVLSVNIAQRLLQHGATAQDKVYDGTTTATLAFADNRVAGDQLSFSGTGTFADKNAGANKAVAISGITVGGADAGNYTLAGTTATGSASITRAPLTVTAADASKFYGDTLAFGGAEFSAAGLVAGETIGQVTLASAGSAPGATVSGGPYGISASDARGGSFDIANYLVSYQAGQLVVRPRPVTVATNSVVRFADEPNPVTWGFSTSAGGLIGSDSIVSVVQAAPAGSANAPGGSVFELLPSGAVFGAGTDAANYELRYASGLLVVLPKPPRIGDGTSAGGGGDVVFAVQIDPAELRRALGELERAASVAAQAAGGTAAPDAPPPGLAGQLEASAADISVALSGDARRISLPALLRLPLISFDPQLQRLIFGTTAAAPR
jgi:filamentous hemagglutinin family protein